MVFERNPARVNWRKIRAGLLLVLRLAQPLAVQKGPRLFFLIHFVKGSGNCGLDHLPVDALDLQIGDHAHAAELLVVAAE